VIRVGLKDTRGGQKIKNSGNYFAGFSALQVIFLFAKQENVLIRALICGPTAFVWVAGKVPALVVEDCLWE
jgi:hypothetical protein